MTDTAIRCIKLCLQPNKTQAQLFASYAGTARWAYNFALDIKTQYQKRWFGARDKAIESGLDAKAANKKATEEVGRMPNYMSIATNWTKVRDEVSPWYTEVPRRVFVGGFQRADSAFKNWFDSVGGKRSGAKVGYPKFKVKGKSRDSFSIAADIQPSFIRPLSKSDGYALPHMDYRHIKVPKAGEVRVSSGSAGLLRKLARQMINELRTDGEIITRITSGTITRLADRWYVSLVISEPAKTVRTTKRQLRNGVVGVDLGSGSRFATTSSGVAILSPKYINIYADKLARAQQAHAKTSRGSAARRKATKRVARVYAKQSLARDGFSHQVSAWLTSQHSGLAVEKFDLKSMIASAKGTVEKPGKNVKVKAKFNAHLADASLASTIDKLIYKGARDGCTVQVVNTLDDSSTTCSQCGNVQPCPPSEKTFECNKCHYKVSRQFNSAQYVRYLGEPGFKELNVDLTPGRDTADASNRPLSFTDGRKPVKI